MSIINEQYKKKLNKLQDTREQERQSLRYQKTISEVAKRIIEKEDKRLSYKDWEQIALTLGGRIDYIRITRLKRHMTTDIAKRDINQTIRLYLLEKGYNEQKIEFLLEKAEKEAKSTKDFLDVIKQIRDLISNDEPKSRITESYEAELSNIGEAYESGKKEKRKLKAERTYNIGNDTMTDESQKAPKEGENKENDRT